MKQQLKGSLVVERIKEITEGRDQGNVGVVNSR